MWRGQDRGLLGPFKQQIIALSCIIAHLHNSQSGHLLSSPLGTDVGWGFRFSSTMASIPDRTHFWWQMFWTSFFHQKHKPMNSSASKAEAWRRDQTGISR